MNPENKGSMLLAAVGDIGLFGEIARIVEQRGPGFAFGGVKPVFDNADIVFGNLEIPFAKSTMRPNFREIPSQLRSDPKSVSTLQEGGFDVISLANNHIMDYGKEGLEFTMQLLEESGIKHIGAGCDLKHARCPVILDIRGLRVGFLAYAKHGKHSAGQYSPGAAPIDKCLIVEDLKNLRNNVDFLVVSLHFGMMYTEYPTPEDQMLSYFLIDCGANIIFGHHPHVLQGIEKYHGGVIIYSLGEFIFDSKIGNVYASFAEEIRKETIIARIRLDHGGLDLSVIPIWHGEDRRPEICTGEKKEAILKRLHNISETLKIFDVDSFNEHVASRTVAHNIRVLAVNLKKMNWKYVIQKIFRIRRFHLRLLFEFIKINLRSRTK